jgi:hypothetical protein
MHEILLQLVLGVHRRLECGRDSRKKILASKKLCCASHGEWSEEVLSRSPEPSLVAPCEEEEEEDSSSGEEESEQSVAPLKPGRSLTSS